jgi:hypothetical protein
MFSHMQMKGFAFAIILIYLHLRYDISLPPFVHREHAYARECHGAHVRSFHYGDTSVEFLILRSVHALASPHAPSDFVSAAPVHKKQCLMTVMKNERPKTSAQRSIVIWSQLSLREKSAERK